MKKQDLVAGKHFIKHRNGDLGVLLYNQGSVVSMDMTGAYSKLSRYNDNLINNCDNCFDIMAVGVYDEDTLMGDLFDKIDWIWERKEIKLTEAERTILENIDKQYKYIARDEGGALYIYVNEPIKGERLWDWCHGLGNSFGLFEHLFNFIKWEDSTPYKIEELLK